MSKKGFEYQQHRHWPLWGSVKEM